MKIKKKTKPAATIEAVATIITFPGVDMSDCIKLLEKEYPFYPTNWTTAPSPISKRLPDTA